VVYGENVMVTGSVPVSGANVTVNYALLDSSALNTTTLEYSTANDTLPNQISNDTVVSRLVSADSSGSFSDSCSLNKTGKWIVWATWNGSETYFGASSAYGNVTVKKVYISVTWNVSSTVTIGDNITVTGSIYPVTENLPVTVIFIATNSRKTNRLHKLEWNLLGKLEARFDGHVAGSCHPS